MWVTVWVKVLTHTLTHIKSCQKVRKTPDFRMKSGVFGAGGVIRTHDLLITNQLLYLLSYTSKYTTFRREVYCSTKKAPRQHKHKNFYRSISIPYDIPCNLNYTNSIFPSLLAKKSGFSALSSTFHDIFQFFPCIYITILITFFYN